MRTLGVLGLVLSLHVVAVESDGLPPQTPPVRELITAYQAGDYATVEAALAPVTDLKGFGRELVRATWSYRVTRGAAFEPRLVVAGALALELVRLNGAVNRADALTLLEVGCELVRLNDEPGPVERLWLWSAAALMEGIGDGRTLELHTTHSQRRFPDDPAFVMARAVAAEIRTYPDVRDGAPGERDLDAFQLAFDRLDAARAVEGLTVEATLRLGMLRWRVGEHDAAIELLKEAAMEARQPEHQYLSALILGRAYESRGDDTLAATAYEGAMAALPGAQTAALALTANLARRNLRADAAEVAEAAVAPGPRPHDPWLSYGQPDLVVLPQLLARLREALR
jgi:tetratricopeptide (TPR) repeat protein